MVTSKGENMVQPITGGKNKKKRIRKQFINKYESMKIFKQEIVNIFSNKKSVSVCIRLFAFS